LGEEEVMKTQDAGHPDKNRQDLHKPGESPALQQNRPEGWPLQRQELWLARSGFGDLDAGD